MLADWRRESARQQLIRGGKRRKNVRAREGRVDVFVHGGTSGNAGDGENGWPDNLYKSRILGAAGAGAALARPDPTGFLSKMAPKDQDGKGWVMCTRNLVY